MKSIELAITEKQILNLLISNNEYLDKGEVLSFISKEAIDCYTVLMELRAEGFEINSENILTHWHTANSLILLQSILDATFQIEKYEFYISELKKYNLYNEIDYNSRILQKEVQKEAKDLDLIDSLSNTIQESVELLSSGREYKYLSTSDILDEHEEVLKKRTLGIKQSSGDVLFDKLLGGRLQSGVMILAANSGQGKSAVTGYLALLRMIKNLPTFLVNTELSRAGWTDNILPSILDRTSYYDLVGLDKENTSSDLSQIMEEFKTLKIRMKNRNKFLMYPESSLDLKSLKKFMLDSRKLMNLKQDDILFGIVDLLSMVSEFSVVGKGNRADNIEVAMNILNSFCIDNNIFLMATTQLKRKDKVKSIERDEDLLEFKPSMENIKSSSSYQERARWVVGLYAPYKIVHSHPCNPILRDLISPISTLTLLKDSYNNQDGLEIQYLMDLEKKMFIPYVEEKEDGQGD